MTAGGNVADGIDIPTGTVPCAGQAAAIKALGLPASIQVRHVRVLLDTGEFEVLVTSLLDEARYPTEGFRNCIACAGNRVLLWPGQDPPGTGKLHRQRGGGRAPGLPRHGVPVRLGIHLDRHCAGQT